MAEKKFQDFEGLVNRASTIFELLEYFPDELSDEEIDGLMHFLPNTCVIPICINHMSNHQRLECSNILYLDGCLKDLPCKGFNINILGKRSQGSV